MSPTNKELNFQAKQQLRTQSDEEEPKILFSEQRSRGLTEGYVKKSAITTPNTKSTESQDEYLPGKLSITKDLTSARLSVHAGRPQKNRQSINLSLLHVVQPPTRKARTSLTLVSPSFLPNGSDTSSDDFDSALSVETVKATCDHHIRKEECHLSLFDFCEPLAQNFAEDNYMDKEFLEITKKQDQNFNGSVKHMRESVASIELVASYMKMIDDDEEYNKNRITLKEKN